MFCIHQEICNGCQLIESPEGFEKQSKTGRLTELLGLSAPSLSFYESLSSGKRVKTDLTYYQNSEGKALGFFEKNSNKKLFNLDRCSHWTSSLEAFFQEIKPLDWPFSKASFRLRIGASGQKALWIDAANKEIKDFMLDTALVQSLLEKFHVEVGQKQKRLIYTDRARLVEAEPDFLFETSFQNQKYALYSFVGSFTQPSFEYNELIMQRIQIWLQKLNVKTVLELGSGIGNITIPLALQADHLVALENSPNSLACLIKNVEFHKLQDKVTVVPQNFHTNLDISQKGFDLVFCNPARSGIQGFAQTICHQLNNKYLIYMSCYPESLKNDFDILKQKFDVVDFGIIDQFPKTDHFESLVLFQRKE